MGRPRTITDERVMAALAAAIGRVGAARLTLADVAGEAGVSPGMLVQRYGTKRGLLLAFMRQAHQGGRLREVYDSAPDPLEGLIRAVVDSVGPETPPEEFANHLGFLHLELADEEFRELLAVFDETIRAELTACVAGAVTAGQLVVGDVAALVAAINSIRNGTQITWAMTRSTSLAEAMRRDLTTLLAGYRT